jgi:hypothetical protein
MNGRYFPNYSTVERALIRTDEYRSRMNGRSYRVRMNSYGSYCAEVLTAGGSSNLVDDDLRTLLDKLYTKLGGE